MEHDIPFASSNRENGTTFLDFPLFLGIFQWDEPTKRVPFTAEPEIPVILTKWKAPRIPESGKFLHLESGILEIFACGIRNTGVGIRNPTNNSNPESKFHLKKSGIQ